MVLGGLDQETQLALLKIHQERLTAQAAPSDTASSPSVARPTQPSKTKVIFPELLHIDAITHIDGFFEWAGQKETIVIFEAHCTGDFAELPIPVQIPEIRWRERYENAITPQKETKKSKKGVKEVHGEDEPEEDAEYKCRACGRKVEEDLVKLHRKKCPAYKAKGLDEIEISDDEADDAAGANGIISELEGILKGKERKLGTDSEEESKGT
ncbi:hypothetical protein QFC20_007076 [Naganishia adeliensis]|uniref:Uncharacterized protein n=1 Tax=Naganishia adeliensis TaxID=92952 RepID=A0ACC2V356_9TREE|nr:hypothetical protein QFC20_007076 [Naganishia adeliensis]